MKSEGQVAQSPPEKVVQLDLGQKERQISAEYARFASSLEYENIPEEIVDRAKYLILDALGIAFASTTYEFAHKSLSGLSSFGAGEVPIIGFPANLQMRDAVAMNAILVHGLDYDDTHIAGVIHPTASCLPCAMGVGVQRGASGKHVIAAYILGMEIAARLGAVAKGGFHQVGFHPTGVVGTFACALIAGSLMGLNERKLAMAQGIALSLASGSLEFLQDGAWTKRLHPGWAGVAGIQAAVLASNGFIGPKAVYEGRFGLFPSYLGSFESDCDYTLATAGLGDIWEVGNVAVKPFPACHFTHACADATLILARENQLSLDQIDSITALVPEEVVKTVCEPIANKRHPANSYEAQFSIPYVIACCLVRDCFGLTELDDSVLSDPRVLEVAKKVSYQVDPDSGFPKYYSGEVVIKLKDGRTLRHREEQNRGCQDRPLSSADIEKKFAENAQMALAPQRAKKIRELILNLEREDNVKNFAGELRC